MRVFLTGATGEIGVPLVERLLARGDQPVVLSRDLEKVRSRWSDSVEGVEGNPMEDGPWMQRLRGCDAVVNLVGERIAEKPWTPSQKQLIHDSRTVSTRNLVETMRGLSEGRPKTLVSASAIAFYGAVIEGQVDEHACADSTGFLPNVCIDWEREALLAADLGVRTVVVRVGLVLSNGGAFLGALWPWRLGLGAQIGNGKQGMSWIHIDDIVGLYLFALDNPQVSGPLNGTAPNPVSNAAFSQTLADVLNRPLLLRAPAAVVKLALGELSTVVVEGLRAIPRRPLELGYRYQHPELREALVSLVKQPA